MFLIYVPKSMIYDSVIRWNDMMYDSITCCFWDCLMLQFVDIARLYDVFSVCVCSSSTIWIIYIYYSYSFMWISGLWKNSFGHMRWGMAFKSHKNTTSFHNHIEKSSVLKASFSKHLDRDLVDFITLFQKETREQRQKPPRKKFI